MSLRPKLQAMVARLGLPGTLGLALIAFSASFQLGTVMPARHEVRDLGERAAELRTQWEQRKRATAAAARNAQPVKAGETVRPLPRSEQAVQWLQRLNALAAESEIVLAQGEYELTTDPKSNLEHYRITLPVKGPYPRIRAFMTAAQSEIPGLSLDGIAIRRERIDSGEIEAKIRFTLHLVKS